MKTTKFLFLITLISFGISTNMQAKKKDDIKTTVFNVNMHCESCKVKFENNIAFEKGVKDMNIDLNTKTVCITYNTKKNSDEKLIKAFKELGYTAKVEKECLSKEECIKKKCCPQEKECLSK